MGNKDAVGQGIPDADGRYNIKSKEGEVNQVVPVQRLILKVGMDQPEPAQGLFADGVIREVCYKDAFCISDLPS